MNLLVITMSDYQDIELISFIGTLNASNKINRITYWNPDNLNEVIGSQKIGYIKTICNEINVDEYDAVFIPGGKACQNLRKNSKAINVIKSFIEKDKYVFAICDAPNVIAEHKLFLNKKYVSYPIENIDKLSTEFRQKKSSVFVDDKYITGKSPSSSIDLGLKVIEVIYGKKLRDIVWEKLNGGIE